jgi:hypothetical protein
VTHETIIAEDKDKGVRLVLGNSMRYRLEVRGKKIKAFRNLGAALAAFKEARRNGDREGKGA